MNRADFLRVFQLRSPNIMWLLGAGASASAGIRTAGQMIWHFKQQIFCAEQRVSIKSCPDLGDAAFRARLDGYFAAKGGYPAPGSDEEYPLFFERAYPTEKDRHLYIDKMVTGVSPSHGHLALGSLAKLNFVRTIWTTNFDRLPEDALAKAFGSTSAYAVATLDAPELAEQALSEARRPVVVKLHGDFSSRRLKNIKEELKVQDVRLRRALMTECQRQGLAVAGFSGRDSSVMEMLERAIEGDHSYPGGLFWFHRPDGPPFARVQQLIERARDRKIDAHLIEVETFDELMLDLFLLRNDPPEEIKAIFAQRRKWLTPLDIPPPGPPGSFPVIRMNAVPVTAAPATCRLVECSVGKTSEIRDAIEATGVNVVAMKRKAAIICFGSDQDVRSAFDKFTITKLDLYAIDAPRLDFDSAELGLLNEAIARALARECSLGLVPMRRGWKLFIQPEQAGSPQFVKLSEAVRAVAGKVPGTELGWAEAVRVRLERKLDRLWLLVEPSVWIDYPSAPESDEEAEPVSPDDDLDAVKEFIRERAATRYNSVLNNLLDGWVDVLVGSTPTRTVRTLGIGDGVDASFTLLKTTGFSRWGGKL